MAVEIVKQWKERTGITIAESYGMTEAMPVTYNHYYRHVVGSVGSRSTEWKFRSGTHRETWSEQGEGGRDLRPGT